MTATALVIYHGTVSDAARFRDHYENVHVPLLWNLPGLRRVDLDWDEEGDVRLVAHLIFDSLEQLRESLRGPARAALKADMETNLAPLFSGSVLRSEAERVVFSTAVQS